MKHESDSTTAYLDRIAIPFRRYDHPAVFTSEQARQLKPAVSRASTKNLFLRDKRGVQHYLLVFDDSKQLDLKSLAHTLVIPKLSLASPERLMKYLGITPGAVSLLALINDSDRQVAVIFDKDIRQQPHLKCHPLVNTATLLVARAHIGKFQELNGHSVKLVDLPK
jgi:Ala-tRNA(Pro) deacylase